mgnify:CR=1 FL=1
MAFSKGNITKESEGFSLYTGIAPVNVLAVNPTKEELEKIYNREQENDPVYITENDFDGKKVKSVRIDFIVKAVKEFEELNFITKVSFFLREAARFNRDETKVQVIDIFGNTAWVTKEELNTHAIPVYSNGPANLNKDYRPCFVGEEALTNFLKLYLGIPSNREYKNGTWIPRVDTTECEARLSDIKKYFTGDFSELKDIMAYQPDNYIKCLFGVRTTDDNKQYQTVFTEKFISGNSKKFETIEKELNARKDAGAYSTTEFDIAPLHKYEVTPTTFSNNNDPLAGAEKVIDNPWNV